MQRLQRKLGISLAGAALLLTLSGGFVPAGAMQAPSLLAPAPPITVNTPDDDESDGCYINACTLREAITAAGADDTIDFSVKGTITLQSGTGYGQLVVDKKLTINGPGPGPGDLTISGGGATRVFYVYSDGVYSDGDLTLKNATISGGSAERGGGIINRGTLTVSNSTLSGNSAKYGGGIYNRGTDNNLGKLTVENSTLSGNSAGWGGGIFNRGTPNNLGTLTVSNSTLSGNSAGNGGGGIYNNYGTLTVSNSTLSGNSADGGGGGITNYGTLTVSNSTLSGNSANDRGGGIYNYRTLTVSNSLVSGNSAATAGNEVWNRDQINITANNYNLFGHSGETDAQAFHGFTPGATSDINATSDGTSVALANILDTALADNGGPTKTHSLVNDSPAMDNRSCTAADTDDQRGVPRPVGSKCDIGAVEHIPISIANLGDGHAELSWEDAGLPSYKIQRATDPYGVFEVLEVTPEPSPENSYEVDVDIDPEQNYYYEVLGINGSDVEVWRSGRFGVFSFALEPGS